MPRQSSLYAARATVSADDRTNLASGITSPSAVDYERQNLALQLDLNDFERFLARVFRQVSKGIHVHHRPRFCFDVLIFSIRVGELGLSVRQKHCYGFRMAVHHRFLARFVLDPNHSNSIILELDCVVLGIDFHGVIGGWLRHSCSCHVLLLSILWDADKSSLRAPESTLYALRRMNTYTAGYHALTRR